MESKVLISNADVSITIGRKRILYNWIRKVIASEKKEVGNLLIICCSDKFLLGMNKKFLAHDYYTDVITFDYTERNRISGEIYVSIDRIKQNAKAYKTSFNRELSRVIIHGVLHLCGYSDKRKSDIEQMRLKEDQKLKMLK